MAGMGRRAITEDELNPIAPAPHDAASVIVIPVPAAPRPRGASVAFTIAVAICLALAVAIAGLAPRALERNAWVGDLAAAPTYGIVRATAVSLYDKMNEQPHFAAIPLSGPGPVCDDVADRYHPALHSAFALMRGTEDGGRLYDLLVTRDVCVSVENIPYNGGYATSWRTSAGIWFHGTITLDDEYVRSRTADVVAAMLVHEATHIDRAIKGESCDDRTDCLELENGVVLEEEIAAHAAEARWWIAAYGENGKRFSFGADYGENRLAEAYLAGPAVFRAYVSELRSDPREGDGL